MNIVTNNTLTFKNHKFNVQCKKHQVVSNCMLFDTVTLIPKNKSSDRFNKIAIRGKGPDGKWTKKPLVFRESKIFHLCVTRPDMCQPCFYKHIHAASIYTIGR